MDPVTGGLIAGGVAGGSNVVGSVLDYVGASSAQDAQQKMSQKYYELARKQFRRGVEIRMKDLRRSGLNPMLAVGMGPASYSPGPGGSGINVMEGLGEGLQKTGAAAMEAASAVQGIRESKARESAAHAAAESSMANARGVEADNWFKKQAIESYKAAAGDKSIPEAAKGLFNRITGWLGGDLSEGPVKDIQGQVNSALEGLRGWLAPEARGSSADKESHWSPFGIRLDKLRDKEPERGREKPYEYPWSYGPWRHED